MKILKASWLITSDDTSSIIKDAAIVYNEKIIDLGTYEYIKEKYSELDVEDLGANSVLLPGLINSHVHLEFSANTTTLEYGDFMKWLYSVIKNRETLVEKASSELISKKLKLMLKTGTTTIGAISSYSYDLDACVKSSLNTVFFTEVIGSKMEMADTLFADFTSRLNQAKKNKSKNFIPAIAIHSPYSVHPFLVREAINIAKEENLAVSTHFLESKDELKWLNTSTGSFVDFFKNFLQQDKSLCQPFEFLNCFKHINNLSFTHCVEANDEELEQIKQMGGIINHCVTSNRLLNNTKLNLDKLSVPYSIGTDGLSSNNSLSMFDELRNVLLMHADKDINVFAKDLIKAATKNGALALGLNKGVLEKDYDSDIISITLPDEVENEEFLCTQVILHAKLAKKIIIGGTNV